MCSYNTLVLTSSPITFASLSSHPTLSFFISLHHLSFASVQFSHNPHLEFYNLSHCFYPSYLLITFAHFNFILPLSLLDLNSFTSSQAQTGYIVWILPWPHTYLFLHPDCINMVVTGENKSNSEMWSRY